MDNVVALNSVGDFRPWPKIPRLNREIVVTEKIDGTNAAIVVGRLGSVHAQSRTRRITPEDDNFGFAQWVAKNDKKLAEYLGEGYHFGEWWGVGIQRGYGIHERRFSLFNTKRWQRIEARSKGIPGLDVVPILYEGPFDVREIEHCIERLRKTGSAAEPGFIRPEGVVVYHKAGDVMFKVTLERDEEPKSSSQARRVEAMAA